MQGIRCDMDFDPDRGRIDDVIQELFLGEVVYLQEPLELQMTVESSYAHGRDADTLTHPLLLELGLVEDLQLQVEVPYVTQLSGAGSALGNASAGFAVGLVNSRALGFAVSTGVDAALPAASEEFGEQGYGVEPFFVVYKMVGPVHFDLSAHADVGGLGQGATLGGGTTLGAFVVQGPWAPSLELAVAVEDGAPLVQAAPGLTVIMPRDVWLGLAGILPLTTDGDYSALLSFTWESELARSVQ